LELIVFIQNPGFQKKNLIIRISLSRSVKRDNNKMNLIFERVFQSEYLKIETIYEIIKRCGENMFLTNGLMHWKNPYPIENIKKDCQENEVFLVYDALLNKAVHTFQLEFNYGETTESKLEIEKLKQNTPSKIIYINKFATYPEFSGKGIGKQSIDFIENYSLARGVSILRLDVYNKSTHAIQFYKKNGFSIIRKKPTKHFFVFEMEKKI